MHFVNPLAALTLLAALHAALPAPPLAESRALRVPLAPRFGTGASARAGTAGEPGTPCATDRAALDASAPGSLRREALLLRLARCLSTAGQGDRAESAYRELATGKTIAASPTVLDEIATFLAGRSVAIGSALDAALDATPSRDRPGREALARALLAVAREGLGTRAARAVERLFLDLPDTAAARDGEALPGPRARAARATRDDGVRRARVLLDAPDAARALEALRPFSLPADDLSASACAARVLTARALRRLGRGAEALPPARLAAARCDAASAADALHLVILVIAGRDVDPEGEVAEFERRFPRDSRCDDVLLQRAQALARRGDRSASGRALRRLIERYPDGDMSHDARFLLALQSARGGDATGAIRLFDEARGVAPPGPLADRAAYWGARLRAFPRLDRLEPSRNAAERKRGAEELHALGAASLASYYGLLARTLSADRSLGPLARPAPAPPSAPLRSTVPADASVALPDRLRSDADFAAALTLIDDGYGAEAVPALDAVLARRDGVPGGIDAGDRRALAAAYRAAGADAKSYRVLSPVGGRPALSPPRTTEGDDLAVWTLLYPSLHVEAIAAAARAGISRALLAALAREESAFEPDAVSPTGAVGLCQIQDGAAREGAAILGRRAPSPAELTEPGLNAAIGATYLAQRLESFPPLLALAAYNRGPTAIAALRRRLGAIPVDTFVESIPARETRDYVRRVASSWAAYALLDAPRETPQTVMATSSPAAGR